VLQSQEQSTGKGKEERWYCNCEPHVTPGTRELHLPVRLHNETPVYSLNRTHSTENKLKQHFVHCKHTRHCKLTYPYNM